MMETKKILFTAISTLFVFTGVNVASANNGLIYPPTDNSRIYEYPPENPVASMNNRMPITPINGGGNVYPNVPNYQQSRMNQPRNIPGYRSGMPAPYGIQNRNYPAYNNSQPFGNNMPFANNMPFGNNSGNGFNPFSGGNMPFGNNSGNSFNPFSGGNNMPFGNNSGNSFNPFSGGNNMPFGNNSGNSFNPFSGGNTPFGNNSGNSFNPFSGGNTPFGNNSGNNFNPFSGGNNSNNPMSNMFGNNNNKSMPFFGNTRDKSRKKAWGDERNIWPDFYTDFTDDAWDSMTSGPRDLGRMPGGWRFPHISTPDPVTVSDAITNQFPPMAEEGGNMIDPSDWGLFDDK